MSDNHTPLPDDNQPTPDAGREPEFVPSLPGRMVSVKGLVERILEQFRNEHGDGESNAYRAADTEAKRRTLVRDCADYIFGVESIQLGRKEQAHIIARACSELFSYGPLDGLLRDPAVTTIALEGTEKVAVRYGPADNLEKLDPLFDDMPHMEQTIKRLLRDAGAELRRDIPIIEAGLSIDDRRVAVSLAIPPFVPQLSADIRVHPADPITLDMLAASAFMSDTGQQTLEAIAQSEHGFVIVGDTESAKTTLLGAMLQHLPNPAEAIAVERAGELNLPPDMQRLVVKWRVGDDEGISFAERIQEALETPPQTLALDEVRSDETDAIAPLLRDDNPPRLIWSFRGSADEMRIRSALGMLARMADPTQPEAMVFNLYERLPFIIVVKRRRSTLQLREIAEWQFPDDYQEADDFVYADYTPLMTLHRGDLQATGTAPKHTLNLPDDFWQV